jgi:hypothetical protein
MPSAFIMNMMLSVVTPYILVDKWHISNDFCAKLFREHYEAKHTLKHFDNEE